MMHYIKLSGIVIILSSAVALSYNLLLKRKIHLKNIETASDFTRQYADMIADYRMSFSEITELIKKRYFFLEDFDSTPDNLGSIIENLLNNKAIPYRETFKIISTADYEKAVSTARKLSELLESYLKTETEKYKKEKNGIILIPLLSSLGLILMTV